MKIGILGNKGTAANLVRNEQPQRMCRIYLCAICRQPGGTMVRVGQTKDGTTVYAHKTCLDRQQAGRTPILLREKKEKR